MIAKLFSYILKWVNTCLDDAFSLGISQKTTNGLVISSLNGIQGKQSRLFIEACLAKQHTDLIKLGGK